MENQPPVIATYIERTGGNQFENGYRNLRDISHRRGNGDARFVSARAVKMDGQTTSLLAYGEPFFLQLELEATERIDQLLIGFALTASDGTLVQSTETPDELSGFAMETGLNTVVSATSRRICSYPGNTESAWGRMWRWEM